MHVHNIDLWRDQWRQPFLCAPRGTGSRPMTLQGLHNHPSRTPSIKKVNYKGQFSYLHGWFVMVVFQRTSLLTKNNYIFSHQTWKFPVGLIRWVKQRSTWDMQKREWLDCQPALSGQPSWPAIWIHHDPTLWGLSPSSVSILGCLLSRVYGGCRKGLLLWMIILSAHLKILFASNKGLWWNHQAIWGHEWPWSRKNPWPSLIPPQESWKNSWTSRNNWMIVPSELRWISTTAHGAKQYNL